MLQRSVWAPRDGHGVMLLIAPHEIEKVARAGMVQRVGKTESEVLFIPGPHLLRLGGGEHHMRQWNRNVLTVLDLAVLPYFANGGDLNCSPLQVEEAEAIPPAGGLDVTGFVDQLDPSGGKILGELVN